MNKTKIDYLDYTWNPIVGCNGIGCSVRKVCWAKGQAKRRKGKCDLCYSFSPHYHYERFTQPLSVKKPSRIGVGFMGDIFDACFGITVNKEIFHNIEKASWHHFLSLTKQSRNMLTFNKNWQSFPENLGVGVSINRKADLPRLDDLRATDAVLKVGSFEPLYEDLGEVNLDGIGWMIIGAQTRPLFMPQTEWVTSLMKQAHAKDIPIFVKRNFSKFNLEEYPKSWKKVEKK